jgi:hypothetical protein
MTGKFDPTYHSTVAQVLPVLFALVFVELLLPEDRRISLAKAGPFLLASLTMLVGPRSPACA